MNYVTSLLLLCSAVALADPAVHASDDSVSAPSGQRLVYDIHWGFFDAGQATLDIRPAQDASGRKIYQIELRAHTSGLFSAVYPLEVWMRSTLNDALDRTLAFHKIQNQQDTRITFDWRARTAQYERNGEKREPIALPQEALDPLGLILAVREQSLDVGASLETHFTDGKRAIEGRAGVVREEQVETGLGEFATVMVEPVLDGVGGVFSRSRDPDMKVWISRDEHRLPVRISSKIVFGKLVGELVEVQALPPVLAAGP